MARAHSESLNISQLPARARFQGVGEVLRFNWPYYVVSVIFVLAGAAIVRLANLPTPADILLRLGIAIAGFWTISSILVTLYVYDLSSLYRWDWLAEALPSPPARWAAFHAGLDESSAAIKVLYPDARGTVFDIYDSRTMTERSIERARARSISSADKGITPEAVPLDDSELDAVFLIFAAHEIRSPADRLRFFKELTRVLKAGGRIILVEHLRDLWNFSAYGPGYRHFLPRHEWVLTATSAGLSARGEIPITPFVRCFVFAKGNEA